MKRVILILTSCTMFVFLAIAPASASLAIDWGDAPDPYYPTLDANSGAHHYGSDLYLGEGVSWEMDGQPDFMAQGDSFDDGVLFLTPLAAGKTADIKIVSSLPGRLNAWVDFNSDGVWSNNEEWIFQNHSLSGGDNFLSFNIPEAALTAWTYARFRLSSDPLFSVSGEAFGGEVEDYRVQISHAPVPNAMILLGVGMIGLAGIGRRKTT